MHFRHVANATAIFLLSSAGLAPAASWPQWRGPDRSAVSSETGLLKKWPEKGPRLLWEMHGLGKGYSSVSIVGQALFTMGDVEADGERRQCILAFDLASRKPTWKARVGPPHDDGGPRSTPTVHDGLVYAVGTDGDVVCVRARDGKEVWRKSFRKDFGPADAPGWRFSESPLVDGDALVCTPGSKDALLVALNRKTGDTIWKCAVPEGERRDGIQAQYCSPVVADLSGVRQYVTLVNALGLVGVGAKDGKFLWCYPRIANGTANIPTPVVSGDHVFCSTAYGTGSALLEVTADGGRVKATEVYFLDEDTFQNHHGGFVKVGDHIYGGHGQNAGAPISVELKTGKVAWKAKAAGGGSAAVVAADGMLYFRYDDGTVALIEANPKEYRLLSSFREPRRDGAGGPAWAHPVILDGSLYLRHEDYLFCYDLKTK